MNRVRRLLRRQPTACADAIHGLTDCLCAVRNRIKRRLREAVRLQMDRIPPGWDIIFIARRPIRNADYHQMEAACARLLRRAHLLLDDERPEYA